jgi:ABC-type antimicrobial peptide transport system permease subunit
MLRNYFTIAYRHLVRNRVYSFINVMGLSIGLAAAMLIILYSKDEVSYDRFHARGPQIYRVVNQWLNPDGSVKQSDGTTGHFQGPKFKQYIPEIQAFVRMRNDSRNVRMDGEITNYQILEVDSNFFSVFTFPLKSGYATKALLQPKSIVISEKMAEKFFHNTDVVGNTLEVMGDNRFEPYVITAVAKNCPQNSSIKFDFLLPMVVNKEEYANSDNWFSFFQNTFVVLDPQATPRLVEAKMKRVFETDAKEAIRNMREKYEMKESARYLLQPLTDMHLSTEFTASNGLVDASNPMFSYILGGIAIFILLIACINFVNLTVARSLKRAKEIGVRKVVGGDRSQLVMQFMGESFLLCFIAFVMGIALVQLVLPTFNQLANKALALSYLLDTKLILSYTTIFLCTGLLAGFYPALVLSSYKPIQTLYGRFKLSGSNYLQKSLVVLQFGLASFLIIATLTIYSQFDYLTSKPLGYDDKNLVQVDKWQMTKEEAQLFRNELLREPSIVDVAPKNGGQWGTIAKVNNMQQIQFAYETIDHTFIPLLKIPVIQGRNFSRDLPTDSTQSIIVNESFVKEAGWKNPIGQRVDFAYHDGKEVYQVIGVVKDHHFYSLTQKIGAQLFTMKPTNEYGAVYIKIKPGTETASLKHIEATFKKLFPIQSYSYRFVEAENRKNYESEAKWKQILLFGALLTIFISCIGLFGLATLSAERRTKEIGIRKVLGASVSQIVTLLSTDFLKLVTIAFLIAVPIAWYAASQWLQNYPYRIGISWWIFALAGSLAVIVALATVSFQAIKAALANPVHSLRSE